MPVFFCQHAYKYKPQLHEIFSWQMLYSFVCIMHKTRKLILLKLVLHEIYSEASVVYGIRWVVNAVIKLSLKLFTWFSLVR